jgi:thiol:disulfide interchange protein DsbD
VGRQAGVDVLGALLAGMTIVSLGLWLFGRIAHSPSAVTRYAGMSVAAVSLALAVVVAVVPAMNASAVDKRAASSGATSTEASLAWEPFTDSTLRLARRSGAPVMLDVTADWCLTCKVNERVAFGSDAVRAALDAGNVQLLRADWTSRSREITRLINGFGRSGVPVVILYPPGERSEPVMLPTLLTPGIVIKALDSMPRGAVAALTQTSTPIRP